MAESNLINKLGIVVLNYNNYALTIEMVDGLLNDEYLCKAKIVIVDNKSTNESFEILKEHFYDRIDIIKSEYNGGYAYGNNYGTKFIEKKYPYIKYCAICNPDVILNHESVENMLLYLNESDDVKLVGCKSYDIDGNEADYCWKHPTVFHEVFSSCVLINKMCLKDKLKYTKDYLNSNISYVDVVLGAFFIVEISAFREVGYLYEGTFLYCEEQILSKRFADCNFKIAVLNTCSYIHNHKDADSYDDKLRSFVNHQKSKNVYLKKIIGCNQFVMLLFTICYGIGYVERVIAWKLKKFIKIKK